MKKLAILAALVLTTGVGAYRVAHAATVQPYQQPAFEAAQKSGDPILIFVEASWCPTCAKERPILQTPRRNLRISRSSTSILIPASRFCDNWACRRRAIRF